MSVDIDSLLIQATLAQSEVDALLLGGGWLSAIAPLEGAVCCAAHLAGGGSYIYVELLAPRPIEIGVLAAVEQAFKRQCPSATSVNVSRLEKVFDKKGHSHDQHAHFEYVVETDPEDGWNEEIANWYDSEHMVGLAAVNGCVHASRFINHDHGPKFLARYELVMQSALGSEQWLAVRNTDWSSLCRPHFTNTKRNTFVLNQ
jgi:hypothetical protein